MKSMGYIDCHNHLAEVLRTSPQLLDYWLPEAERAGIGFFMQGGIDPANWDSQIEFKKRYPDQVGLCFGVHPYYASTQSLSDLDIVLDVLARRVGEEKLRPGFLAIGEMGLDLRPAYTQKGTESQIHAFEAQLELADWTDLPMVFHIVRAHPECEQIHSLWSPKNKRGLLHSFSGSLEQAQYWIKQGFLISLGGPVCHEKNKKSRRIATELPLEFLTLETDAPDQPPPSYNPGENPPKTLWEVAKTIGTLRNLDAKEILDISNSNFLRVFGKELDGSINSRP